MANENEGGMEDEFDMDAAIDELADVFGKVEDPDSDSDSELEGKNEPPAEVKEKSDEPEVKTESGEKVPEPEARIEVPKTWRKDAAEVFPTLPKVVQDEILKREDDIFKGIEQYKSDANFGQRMKLSVEKYLPVLEKFNIPVEAQVAATMDAHYRLALGSQDEKLAVLQQIIQDYGIDTSRVVSEVAMVPPEVAQLQTQIRMLESKLNAGEYQKDISLRADVERQITEFSKDPANEHFELVANDMAAIIRGLPGTSLKEAYQKAIWANPQTRELELAKQRVEAEAKAAAAAKERAAKVAKSTAANVRTSAKSGSAAAPTGTMDDTLKAVYAELTANND